MRTIGLARVIAVVCGLWLGLGGMALLADDGPCEPASAAGTDPVVPDATATSDAGVRVIDDRQLQKAFERKVAALIGDEPDVFVADREEQLQRRSCPLELPEPGTQRMTPADIYRKRIDSVVVVGVFYHCASKSCRRLHSGLSSGVVIHESGVLLTNYHVVDVEQPRFMAMAVMTVDGRVFLVREVLATDPAHDVAAIRLEGASGLPAVPVFPDEPVGEAVTLITHPKHHFYSLTSGYVSRYSMGPHTNVVMNITADYAVGSSGGAIFNDRGDIVGLVSSTTAISARNVRLNLGADEHVQRTPPDRHAGRAADAAARRDEEEEAPDGEDEPDGDTPQEKEPPPNEEPPSRTAQRAVNIPSHHQMTIKNAVPSRAILSLFNR